MNIDELIDFEDEKEVEIDVARTYHFPKDVVICKHSGVYLAIYTKGILWLVLENDEELRAFQLLQEGYSIEYALDLVDTESVINVITQIEAKKFEHPVCNEKSDKNIYIYLTNNCNERCKHCYMYAGDVKYNELTPEQWIKVLDSFKECGGNGVTFTGGEVTVYKGFDLVIKHAHEIGLQVTVLTNGILWSEEYVAELHGCIDEIQISIDGYDKESYFRVRQYDGFYKAIQCVKNFSEAGTKVSIAVTPLYEDLTDFVTKFESFAKDLMNEFPNVFIKLNLELIQGRDVSITSEQNKQYKQTLRQMVERLYPEFYTETFVLNYENHTLRRNCGFGEISIAANGDVFWCNRIHELKSNTNVLTSTFKKLLEESERMIAHTSVDNTHGCKDCEIRYICGGGCRMKYEGIQDADAHIVEWKYLCDGKDAIYDKMIKSNEFFFE